MSASRPSLWIFNQYAFPSDRGGITRPYDLAVRLARMGIRVTLFASAFNHYSGRDDVLRPGQMHAVEDREGVRFVWLRTTPYRGNDLRRVVNMCSYVLMASLFQFRFERPTAVLGASAHLLAPLAAYFAARTRRARFYVEIGDIWPQTLVDVGALGPRAPLTRLLRAVELFLYRRARRIIGLLPRMADHVRECGVPPEKVVYVPNGVDPSETVVPPRSPTGRAARAAMEEARASGDFVVLYAGAHGLVNRLEVVLGAAAILEREPSGPVIRIVLMGDGPERPALVGLARVLRLDRVVFLEAVPKDETRAIVELADATVVSMADLGVYRYGLSLNKVFDAFDAGRPVVIATDAPDDPVTLAGAGVVVPPEDPRALADGLRRMAELPLAERRTMGSRGRRYVQEHHDLDRLAERLADALELRGQPFGATRTG